MTTHTKEQLAEMKLPQLRGIAKDLGIAAAGLRPADLVKEIMKAQDAAKPAKVEKKAEPKKAEKPAQKTAKSAAEDPVLKVLKAIVERMDALSDKVNAVAEYCEIEPLGDVHIDLSFSTAPAAVEEAVEEAAEEEEAPPAPKKVEKTEKKAEPKKEEPKKAAKKPEPEEEEEEEELNIDLDDLANMNLEQLQEIAQKLATAGYDEAEEWAALTSPRVLRKKLTEWLLANGEKTVEEEPVAEVDTSDADEEDAEEGGDEETDEEDKPRPAWLADGVKIEVEIEGEGWIPGVVVSTDEDTGEVTVRLDDGDEVEAGWGFLRKRDLKPKARK